MPGWRSGLARGAIPTNIPPAVRCTAHPQRRTSVTTSSSDRSVALAAIARSLTGSDAHVDTVLVLEGLDWRLAGVRPEGEPHSICQIVHPIVYWQEWAAFCCGRRLARGRHHREV